jgi:predicted nucleic acid-binding Zn ribbon protein
MPTYTFKDINTGEELELVLKISELNSFREEHPNLTLVVKRSNFISGHNKKPDSGFRDVLSRIKSANRGSNINTF